MTLCYFSLTNQCLCHTQSLLSQAKAQPPIGINGSLLCCPQALLLVLEDIPSATFTAGAEFQVLSISLFPQVRFLKAYLKLPASHFFLNFGQFPPATQPQCSTCSIVEFCTSQGLIAVGRTPNVCPKTPAVKPLLSGEDTAFQAPWRCTSRSKVNSTPAIVPEEKALCTSAMGMNRVPVQTCCV